MTSKNEGQNDDIENALDIHKRYINTARDAAQEGAKVIDEIAKNYAKMAPGQKPSYVGILLVFGAIGLEFIEPFMPLMKFPDITSTTMLIGGLVSLAVGAGIETWAFHHQAKLISEAQKRAQDKVDELEKESLGLVAKFLGS